MSAHMTQEESDRIVNTWAKGKKHFHKVRDLMGGLVHAQIHAGTHGRNKTDLGFILGPNKLDLDKLYHLSRLLHPETQAEAVAELHAKNSKRQPETAGESVRRAMGKSLPGKPKVESVRDSINRARQEVASKGGSR